MSEKKTRISPSISQSHREKFNSIMEKLKFNQGQTIEHLIDIFDEYLDLKSQADKIQFGEINYHNLGLEVVHNQDGSVKENEIEIVDRAIKNSGLTLEQIIKDGILQRAKYLNTIAENKNQLESKTQEELKDIKVKGIADYRIEQAIELIMKHNDVQGEKSEKICITRGIVFKITGSNRKNINKFFENYHTMIDDHNNKHGLTDKDNRKGSNYDVKQVLGV